MGTAEAGSLGGRARKKNLTPERIAAIGKKGGDARAAKLSATKRKGIAKKAAAARWNGSGKVK